MYDPTDRGKVGIMTPRGIEILVKKASVDGAFKRYLLAERSGAAERIGLALDPAEAAMLDAIPEAQLTAIIEKTKVAPLLRPAFMGYAAAAMLAAVGLTVVGWGTKPDGTTLLGGYIDKLKEKYIEPKRSISLKRYTGIRPDVEYLTKINKSDSIIGADLKAVLGDGAEEETRTREAIHSKVEPHLDRLLSYHTADLNRNPGFPSCVLTVCFRILPDGKASQVEILDDGQGRNRLKRAINGDVSNWHFEPAKGKVAVVYNLAFYRSSDSEEERKWGKPPQKDYGGSSISVREIEVVDDEEFYGGDK